MNKVDRDFLITISVITTVILIMILVTAALIHNGRISSCLLNGGDSLMHIQGQNPICWDSKTNTEVVIAPETHLEKL